VIIHSIVPYETIFHGDGTPVCFETEYLGERVLVSHTSDNRYVITRLLSTSPKAYLNPRLAPGNVLYGIM